METTNTINKQQFQENGISLNDIILKLREWVTYLLSNWRTIILAGVIGGFLGYVYAYYRKPLYVAELTFVLEEGHSEGAGTYNGIASQLGIDLGGTVGGGAFEGENLFALMKSRLMIEKVLLTPINIYGKNITLAEFYIQINRLRKKWAKSKTLKDIRFIPGSDPSQFSIEQNALITGFYNDLIANNIFADRQDKKSSLICIRVTSENELFSKYFTEIMVKEVSDLYIETKTKKSSANVAILQRQADSIRRVLNFAITGIAASVDANPNQNLARQILNVPSQRRQIDIQVNQAIFSQLMQNLEIAKMSQRKETPLIQIIDRPILPLSIKTFGKVKGFILGSFLIGFLAIMYLLVRRIFQIY